jgi:hypothetical protein
MERARAVIEAASEGGSQRWMGDRRSVDDIVRRGKVLRFEGGGRGDIVTNTMMRKGTRRELRGWNGRGRRRGGDSDIPHCVWVGKAKRCELLG